MDPTEVALTAPPGTAVPQELLAEMLWFFRMEDGEWQRAAVGMECISWTTPLLWIPIAPTHPRQGQTGRQGLTLRPLFTYGMLTHLLSPPIIIVVTY